MYKISISGKANSGKNLLSQLISSELSQDDLLQTSYIAFADPIKEIILLTFPKASRKNLYGSSELRKKEIPNAFKNGIPLTYRQALIDIGMRGREYNEDIWINNFDKRFNKIKNTGIVIVTDCRFRNEFDHLKLNGFYMIRLLREKSLKINHQSETEQESINDSEFHTILNNNKSVGELEDSAKAICSIIKSMYNQL